MKFEIEAELFRKIMYAVYKTRGEARFRFGKEGLNVRTFDEAHVCMIDLFVPKSVFTSYEDEEDVVINIKEARKFLTGVAGLLRVDIGQKIEFSVYGTYGVRRFGLPILVEAETEPPFPKMPLNVEAKVIASAFMQAVRDAEKVDNYYCLETEKDGLAVWVMEQGTFRSSYSRLEIGKAVMGMTVKEESKSYYGIELTKNMLLACEPFANVLTLRFSTNIPLKLECQLPFEGRLEFWLAPRIEVHAPVEKKKKEAAKG